MPNCKSFLFTEAQTKHVRRRARFQKHRDASSHQVIFFLRGKAPKEIHAILKETLEEHAPSYGTTKNWVVQFKRGDFSTCDAPRPGRPKTVTTSPRFFWNQDGILLIDYLSKGQTINAEYYSSLLVQLKDILKENAAGQKGHQGGLVLARQYPCSPGTCNPEEIGLLGLPVS